MSYTLFDVYDNARVRHTAKTITSGSGNFENDTHGRAILDASTATWITAGTRIGDYILAGGTREIHRATTAAATSVSGGESFKFFNGDNSRSYVVWFQKNGSGTAPTVTTEILLGPVNVTTGQTAANIATSIRTLLNNNDSANTYLYKDVVLNVGGTGSNVDITNNLPGNCTNIALFSGTLTGWSFTATTAGTAASANDGIYRVREIISETRLILEQAWPSPGIAVAGTATTYVEKNKLLITDETTVTLANIHSNINNPRICEQLPIGPTANFSFVSYIWRMRTIQILHTGATHTDINMNNAVVMSAGGSTNSAESTTITTNTNDPGTMSINSGTFGSDNKSVKDGCFFAAVTFGAIGTVSTIKIAASAFMHRGGQHSWGGADFKISGVLSMGNYPFVGSLQGCESFNNAILSDDGGNGFTIVTTIDSSDNILIADTATAGFLFNTDEFTVTGLDMGDDAGRPLFNLFGNTTPTVLDPFQDFGIDELFSNSGGLATKSYTFNPRFVFRNKVTRTPIPIENLTVSINQIEIQRELEVLTYDAATTYSVTINGTTVNASGGGTVDAVASALASAINANGTLNLIVSASAGGGVVRIDVLDLESDIELSTSVVGGTGTITTYDQTETDLGDFLTNANGLLNAGIGLELARGVLDFGVVRDYKYDVLVQGGPIRSRRYYFIPRGKFDDDIVFDVQQFDLEGELGI